MQSDAGGAPVRRLHPFSWLFVLLTQLRQFILPIIAVVFVGSGETWELWGIVGALALAGYSLIYSFGFRYQLARDELIVREGLLHRTERHVPYERIQNIVHKRNPLHRAFGVVELRLESAGGTKPEAVMNVITLADAALLESVLRGARHAHGEDVASDGTESPPLLSLDAREVLKLGLVTNRGGVVVGAIVAFFVQLGDSNHSGDGFRRIVSFVVDLVGAEFRTLLGPVSFVVTAIVLVATFLVAMKLLSIMMAFLSFHDFRLTTHGERVSAEGGLLTRHKASARRDKLQRLQIGETWLARKLGRRWLGCDVAATVRANENDAGRLRWLAPIATPAQISALIDEIAPGLDIERLQWCALHPRAWRRMFAASLFWFGLITLPATILIGWNAIGLFVALALFGLVDARRRAAFAGYALEGDVLAVRTGWLHRRWAIAKIEKGQAIKVGISPFDRRHGMGSVLLDTAGAGPNSVRLRVSYIDEAEARRMAGELRARM